MIDIETVKKASELLKNNITSVKVEKETGIKRAVVKDLVALYDLMLQIPVKSIDNEFVTIRKSRYIIKSLKLQHRMQDIRREKRVLSKRVKDIVKHYESMKSNYYYNGASWFLYGFTVCLLASGLLLKFSSYSLTGG